MEDVSEIKIEKDEEELLESINELIDDNCILKIINSGDNNEN